MTTIDPDDNATGMPRVRGRRINPDLAPTGLQKVADIIRQRQADRHAQAEIDAAEKAELEQRRAELTRKLRDPNTPTIIT